MHCFAGSHPVLLSDELLKNGIFVAKVSLAHPTAFPFLLDILLVREESWFGGGGIEAVIQIV